MIRHDYLQDPLVVNYQDRGMMKWMGFYLSEHTSQLESESRERNTQVLSMGEMSLEEIEEKLAFAHLKNRPIYLQIKIHHREKSDLRECFGPFQGADDWGNIYVNGERISLEDVTYVGI